MTPTDHNLRQQLFWLLVLAIPIACIARTVVFEDVFREVREYCVARSKTCRTLARRKFFYMLTCEYCFSHYVAALLVWLTHFQLLLPGWRGYLIAFLALVFVANAYLNLYARLRVDITSEKKEIEVKEKQVEATEKEIEAKDKEIQKLEAELGEAHIVER